MLAWNSAGAGEPALEPGIQDLGHHRDRLQVDHHVVLQRGRKTPQHAIARGFGAGARPPARRPTSPLAHSIGRGLPTSIVPALLEAAMARATSSDGTAAGATDLEAAAHSGDETPCISPEFDDVARSHWPMAA